jgi:hypothetical protein
LIGVFVCDLVGIQTRRLDLQQVAPALDFLGGETAIHQYPDMSGFDQVGIALTAAAQAGESHSS